MTQGAPSSTLKLLVLSQISPRKQPLLHNPRWKLRKPATAMAALTLHFTMHKEEIRQVQEASERASKLRTSPQTRMNAAVKGGPIEGEPTYDVGLAIALRMD